MEPLNTIQSEMLKFATEFAFSQGGNLHRITRYDNHGKFIADGKWVVICGPSREFFYCNGRWEYKKYSVFDTPEQAWQTIQKLYGR